MKRDSVPIAVCCGVWRARLFALYVYKVHWLITATCKQSIWVAFVQLGLLSNSKGLPRLPEPGLGAEYSDWFVDGVAVKHQKCRLQLRGYNWDMIELQARCKGSGADKVVEGSGWLARPWCSKLNRARSMGRTVPARLVFTTKIKPKKSRHFEHHPPSNQGPSKLVIHR